MTSWTNRLDKLTLYNLPSEDKKEGKSFLSNRAYEFASLFRYHFCLYVDGRDVPEEILTELWYPLLERSGKDQKYADELLKNAPFKSYKHKVHHNKLIEAFEEILTEMEKGEMRDVGGFGSLQERVKKALLALDPGLVNPTTSYESFRRFGRLFNKRMRVKGKKFETWENGLWRESQNRRNDIHDIIIQAIDNCDPLGKKAREIPLLYSGYLEDFLKKYDTGDKEEALNSVDLLFFDDKKKKEEFLELMETNFDHLVPAIKSTVRALDYDRLQEAKDTDPTFLAFEPQECKAKKGPLEKLPDQYLLAFSGFKDDDGKEVPLGGLEVKKPTEDSAFAKRARADYLYRNRYAKMKIPELALERWYVKTNDIYWLIKQMHLNKDAYEKLMLSHEKKFKSHEHNPFPQHDQKKGDDHWFAVKRAVGEFRKGKRNEKELKKYVPKKNADDVTLKELMQAKGISFAKDGDTLPDWFLKQYPLPEGYAWIRTVEDARRVLFPGKYYCDYLVNPKTAKRNYFELHLNYNRSPRKLLEALFLSSDWGSSGKTTRASIEECIYPDMVTVVGEDAISKGKKDKGSATTHLNAFGEYFITFCNDPSDGLEIDDGIMKNLTDDAMMALRKLYCEMSKKQCIGNVYVLHNKGRFILSPAFSLHKRIKHMKTETYVWKAGHGKQKPQEGWSEDGKRFTVILNGNHHVFQQSLSKPSSANGSHERKNDFFTGNALYRRDADVIVSAFGDDLPMPMEVIEETQEFLLEANALLQFLKDCCILTKHGSTIKELMCALEGKFRSEAHLQTQLEEMDLYDTAEGKTRLRLIHPMPNGKPERTQWLDLPEEVCKEFENLLRPLCLDWICLSPLQK